MTSRTVGFISASSGAPIGPLAWRLRMRWTVTTSASRNGVCLSTKVAPTALAFSPFRFWLQHHLHSEGETDARDLFGCFDVAQTAAPTHSGLPLPWWDGRMHRP